MGIKYLKEKIDDTWVYLVKAPISEYKIVLTEPSDGDTLLETTSSFAKRVGAEVAVNSNFFKWINKSHLKGTVDTLKWAVGLKKLEGLDITPGKLRKTLAGTPCIQSGILPPYYYKEQEVKKYISGGIFNYPFDGGCDFYTTMPPSVYNAVQPIGLVINYGKPGNIGDGSNFPKTILGRTHDEYVFFVSDGRGNNGSPGLSYQKIQEYLLKHNVLVAVATDGGESSSLVINNKLVNYPRDEYCALSQLFSHRFILGAIKLIGWLPSERPVGLNIGLVAK